MANGLHYSITDCSRPVAADRWYVKVVCSLAIPVRPESYATLATGDPELDRIIAERLGDSVEHQLVRERNFVDHAVKDELVAQLAERLRVIVDKFVGDPGFPERLLAVKFREISEICTLEKARLTPIREEDDEPADFSHCFR